MATSNALDKELHALATKVRTYISLGKCKTFDAMLEIMDLSKESKVFPAKWKEYSGDITGKIFGDFYTDLRAEINNAYSKRNEIESPPLEDDSSDDDINNALPQHPVWNYLQNVKNLEPSTLKRIGCAPHLVLPTHQKKAICNLLYGVLAQDRKGFLVRAKTGSGKTFIAAGIVKVLYAENWFRGKSISPWRCVYLTPPSAIPQAERRFRNFFNIQVPGDCYINSLDGLRSSWGKKFIKTEVEIKDGNPVKVFRWLEHIHPKVIFIDECQRVKNSTAKQTQIIQALAKLDDPPIVINLSATPFAKVSEAKSVVLNMRIPYDPYAIL